MKKVVLSALFAGTTLVTVAQGIKSTNPGYAFDSFNDSTSYNNPITPSLGIYLWNDTLNTKTPYFQNVKSDTTPTKRDGLFASKKVRAGNGKVSYVVSQPYGLFKPQVGVTFGTGNSIDISGAGYLKVRVGLRFGADSLANSATGLKVKFDIQDLSGIGIDSKGANGGKTKQYYDEIAVIVKNGVFSVPATLLNTITLDATSEPGTTYVTVNFEGGYQAVYPGIDSLNNSCVGTTKGDQGIPGASKPITGFDATKVFGFQMTILQAAQKAADCYYNYAAKNVKFDLTDFIIGDIATAIVAGVEDEQVFAAQGFVAYPNPTKGGVVKFNTNADNVKVYDALGNVVFSAISASEVNVDTFHKGLYIVKSSKGSTRFVVE